jgi:hypothetical protein
MVCSLFEWYWKSVQVYFDHLFIQCISVLTLEIQSSRRQGLDPINRLTMLHFCAIHKQEPGFPMPYVVFPFLCIIISGGYLFC